jgi:hypothetical protein
MIERNATLNLRMFYDNDARLARYEVYSASQTTVQFENWQDQVVRNSPSIFFYFQLNISFTLLELAPHTHLLSNTDVPMTLWLSVL